MKTLLLLLTLTSSAKAAPLIKLQDMGTGVLPAVLVASATVTGVTNYSFTVSGTEKTYYAVWRATQNTSTSDFMVGLNADTGNNYAYHGRCENSGGASAVPTSAAGAGVPQDEATTNRLTASTTFKGQAVIHVPDSTDFPGIYGTGNIRLADGSTFVSCAIGGFWKSKSAVTSIDLRTTAGTYTGKVWLYSGEAHP